MSKFIKRDLPWSKGVGINVSDCKSSYDVMVKAGLDYHVEKCELMAKMPFNLGNGTFTNIDKLNGEFNYGGNQYRNCPNAYGTYRTDKNIPLGIVKEKYEVVQNTDAFAFFDSCIGPDKAEWDHAGYFGYGERIFISAKIPNDFEVNHDPVTTYLLLGTSHDGSMSTNIMFTTVRAFCTNCLNSALKNADSFIRFKHTRSIKEKLNQTAEILKIASQKATSSKELYEALYKINVKDVSVQRYLAELELTSAEIAKCEEVSKDWLTYLYRKDNFFVQKAGISVKKVTKITSMYEYYHEGIAQENIVGTAWGAYNAVTGYYSNVANMEGHKRLDSLLYGGASTKMNIALNSAIQLDKVA